MKHCRHSFFAIMVLLLGVSLFSQSNYYPGGLGNTNLKVWLNTSNAASLTYNGSNQVSQWDDLSGNGYTFKQTTTGNQPVYSANAGPNSRPAVSFTSTNSQYFINTLLPSTISYLAGISSFSVVNYTASGSFARIFDFGNGSGSDNIIAGRYNTSSNFYYEGWFNTFGGQTYTTSNTIVNGTNNILETVQQGGTAGSQTNVAFYTAGSLQASNGALGSSVALLPQATNRISNFIGRSNWTADAYYNGTMSEILFYNNALNTTQRVIVENYLSASWGLVVTPSYFTPPTSSTYNNNLVGIGYTSSTDNVLSNPVGTVNGSTDGLGFSSGTTASDFLNVAGFAMAAHNGQANTVRSNVTLSGIIPSGVSLFNRSWFIHRTGGNSAGNITVNFNFSDYNSGSLPTGAISYGLLYNAGSGDFSTGTNSLVTHTFTTTGTTVGFVVPASSLVDGYYTLVWSTTSILPVQITSFIVKQYGQVVQLNWTDQEMNFSYFDVQHATATNDFTTIGRVNAAGTAGTPVTYQFTNNNPAVGWNSYRLKMVDADGSVSYSAIKKVDFTNNTNAFNFSTYPNPATDNVSVNCGDYTGKIHIELLSNNGQSVWKADKDFVNGAFSVPLYFLEKGVFFIKITADLQTVVKKIVKE